MSRGAANRSERPASGPFAFVVAERASEEPGSRLAVGHAEGLGLYAGDEWGTLRSEPMGSSSANGQGHKLVSSPSHEMWERQAELVGAGHPFVLEWCDARATDGYPSLRGDGAGDTLRRR